MAIDHIKNSTGTVLNRYTAEKEDGTSENVKLTYNPSNDYVAGTAFAEDTINPMIDIINATLPKLTVHSATGNTVTVACGTITESKEAEDNVAIFYLNTKGTWTIDDGNMTATKDIIDCGDYEVNLMATTYGVQRDITSSSSVWERIDDSKDFNFTASIGSNAGVNDFLDGPIYSKIKRVNMSNGNVMVRIPCFWFKRTVIDNIEKIEISDMEQDGFVKHPAFQHNGKEQNYIYVGAYKTSSNNKSVPNASPTVSQTMATMRANAQALGDGWGLMDITTRSAIQILYLVMVADFNSQDKVGAGYTNSGHSAKINTGSCDAVANGNGRPDGTSDNVDVILLWMEGLWGNIYEFEDGVNVIGGIYYLCNNQAKYKCDSTDGYTALGFTASAISSGAYISRHGYDSNNPGIILPVQTSGASSSTYVCDNMDINLSGNRIVLVSKDWSASVNAGLFYVHAADASSSSSTNVGGRLLYIPPESESEAEA